MDNVTVIEYWHKVPPAIMAYKDINRRIEAIKTSLDRIDPNLKFVRLEGNICLAVKVKDSPTT